MVLKVFATTKAESAGKATYYIRSQGFMMHHGSATARNGLRTIDISMGLFLPLIAWKGLKERA
ncbi:MAG: hypothetical protein H5T33_07875 [Candidatus Methanosuratus sp.]|nr:hypothetical protein [Candidatus Methanosuratincola sp.]